MTRSIKQSFAANQALAYTTPVRFVPGIDALPNEPNVFVVTKSHASYNGTFPNMKIQLSLDLVNWEPVSGSLAGTAGQTNFNTKAIGPISVPIYARVSVPTFTAGSIDITVVI